MLTMPFALLAVQEEHGASPFEPEFGLIIWTWVVFIGLFFVLKKYAWPAILSATEERERKIALQLEEAGNVNAEAKAALEEHRAMLAGAKEEATKLISEAKTVAEKEREATLARAREEQEGLVGRAKREIAAERARAMVELRRETVDLSLAAASRLVGANLDDEANRKLVVDYLGSLEDAG